MVIRSEQHGPICAVGQFMRAAFTQDRPPGLFTGLRIEEQDRPILIIIIDDAGSQHTVIRSENIGRDKIPQRDRFADGAGLRVLHGKRSAGMPDDAAAIRRECRIINRRGGGKPVKVKDLFAGCSVVYDRPDLFGRIRKNHGTVVRNGYGKHHETGFDDPGTLTLIHGLFVDDDLLPVIRQGGHHTAFTDRAVGVRLFSEIPAPAALCRYGTSIRLDEHVRFHMTLFPRFLFHKHAF